MLFIYIIGQVLDAAATKPFGFHRFNPGPGWGGHCIPVDPFYLAHRARSFGEGFECVGQANTVVMQRNTVVMQRRHGDPLHPARR